MFSTLGTCGRPSGCLVKCFRLPWFNPFTPLMGTKPFSQLTQGKNELENGSSGPPFQAGSMANERIPGQLYQHSFDSFDSMISEEKADAKSHILIEDKTNKLDYITKEAMETILDSGISKMYKYRLSSHKYCLVKLDDYQSFSVTNNTNFPYQSFPVYSRMFNLLPASVNQVQDALTSEPEKIPDLLRNRKFWQELLRSDTSMDSDSFITHLVDNVLLNEMEAKLRFFLINQLEELLCSGPFNQLHLLPFGSSVNGFGWNQSDIDLFLTPKKTREPFDNPYQLKSMSSKNMEGDRFDTQRILNILDGLMKDFIPGVENVVPILMARVPIIKFASTSSGLDGDLTFFLDSRDSGIDIAQVLFEYSRLDIRVIKLMIFTKLWAMQQGITRSAPGVWINSFGLMMLVVHFLQIRSPPLLPPISHLNIIYDPYQSRSPKQSSSPSASKLQYDQETPFMELLTQFLYHLATFDFNSSGCNVMDGLVISKPTTSPLFIENPTHRYLNVCKNVQTSELTKLILIASASFRSLCSGGHVSTLLKPFSKKSIHMTDFLNPEESKLSLKK